INAAVASLNTAGVTNLSAATAGEQTAAATAAAAALNAAEPLSVATGIVAALFAVNDAASVAAFPVTAVANTVGGTALVPVSYTNGDSALWVDAGGAAFGRIFQTTTAGGVNSFDVTVRVNVPLVGDANGDSDAALTGDSVVLSLDGGKYINVTNAAVPFATGALLDTNVDVTNP